VIAYMFDLLVRAHGLPMEAACTAMAPPFWSQINRMPDEERELVRAIRVVYGGALLNGPFSVLVGHSGGMVALNDRIKLRPMAAARKDDMLYVASEEAAIREVCREPETLWHARGGVPIIGELRKGTGTEPAPSGAPVASAV
jgi:glutamate synthase domain-containing protein 1